MVVMMFAGFFDKEQRCIYNIPATDSFSPDFQI